MKPALTEEYFTWKANEFPKVQDAFLEELCKEITAISVYDVVHKETPNYRKINLQGIYIHTYKTVGKSMKQLNEFKAVTDKIYEFLNEHQIGVFGERATKDNSYYAYDFWVREKTMLSETTTPS